LKFVKNLRWNGWANTFAVSAVAAVVMAAIRFLSINFAVRHLTSNLIASYGFHKIVGGV